MRKFPGLDDQMIAMWFHHMKQIAPGLVDDLEPLFRNLTIPDLLPVMELFDAFVRYGNLERIRAYDKAALERLPPDIILQLATVTTTDGEMKAFDRGMIDGKYRILRDMVDLTEDGERLFAPYHLAHDRYLNVAAFVAMTHPAGKRLLMEPRRHPRAKKCVRPPAPKKLPADAPTPPNHLKLIASNGEKVG